MEISEFFLENENLERENKKDEEREREKEREKEKEKERAIIFNQNIFCKFISTHKFFRP